ncbi:MAG: peptidylprolyl isomerase [Eubacteriales bacterium]|nr:peptidylprolyl isomerase [Eubacteriales bacterium]
MRNPIATIIMQNGNEIIIELYPDVAPNTVNSFINLAKKMLYNNKRIKRIVKNYLIQPDYNYFDEDECNYFIEGEFRSNDFQNMLPIDKWVVAMAVDGTGLASGSEFFISMGNNEKKLGGIVPGFGKVVSGFDELERIESVETFAVDIDIPGVHVNEPLKPEIIESVTVETFGVEYPEPIIV